MLVQTNKDPKCARLRIDDPLYNHNAHMNASVNTPGAIHDKFQTFFFILFCFATL